MRSLYALPLRHAAVAILALGWLMGWPAAASAQGFGVGPRFSWVRSDVDADEESVRFVGGQVRLLSHRFGLEISMDRHSESFDLLNEKITETPIQASLLLRMGGGRVSPFLLAGPGWYRRKVEALDNPDGASVSTTEFSWHAGIGLEILPSRHFGLHGDYRYTSLDFNDDEEDEGFFGRLLPGHRGSMWTLGATIYF